MSMRDGVRACAQAADADADADADAIVGGHPLCIEPITADDASPPEMARHARACGVGLIGVVVQTRAGRPDWGLAGDTPMRRETLAACRGEGVRVDLIESFPLSGEEDVAAYAPALESGAVLGARWLTLLARDADRARLIDSIHRLCDLSEPLGLGALLEFTPRMSIRTFADAVELVRQVDRPSLGVVVDSLHMARTGAWEASVPLLRHSSLVRRAQLSDGPWQLDADRSLYEAMSERRLPGQGELPLMELVKALPPQVVIGVEVPQAAARAAGVSAAERVRIAVEAARRVVSAAG